MTSDDKYPKVSGRRRFVKGVVGGAALAGIGTATSGTVNTMTNPSGAGGGVTEYFGIEKLFGPAPRGMPQIPVVIDDDGEIIAEVDDFRGKDCDVVLPEVAKSLGEIKEER